MKDAAADLEFETAARLRDEIKRLRETELAIADDPSARQTDVEDRAGSFRAREVRRKGQRPTAGYRLAGGERATAKQRLSHSNRIRARAADPRDTTSRPSAGSPEGSRRSKRSHGSESRRSTVRPAPTAPAGRAHSKCR